MFSINRKQNPVSKIATTLREAHTALHERDYRMCRKRLWSCAKKVSALRDVVVAIKDMHGGMHGDIIVEDQLDELEAFLVNAMDTVIKDDIPTTCNELKDCQQLLKEVMDAMHCKIKNGSFHCTYHKDVQRE